MYNLAEYVSAFLMNFRAKELCVHADYLLIMLEGRK